MGTDENLPALASSDHNPPQSAVMLVPRRQLSIRDMLEIQKETEETIKDALVQGTDYGKVKGIDTPFLFKAGAEKLCQAFACRPVFTVISQEVDHDRRTKFYDKWKGSEAFSDGFYRYVVRCELQHHSGRIVGEGMGSCSSLESKYRSRPHDCENTVLKMAQKRALVAATLTTFSLSNRFTQDEDTVEVKATKPVAKNNNVVSSRKFSSDARPHQAASAPPVKAPPAPAPAAELFDAANEAHCARLQALLDRENIKLGADVKFSDVTTPLNGKPMTKDTVNAVLQAIDLEKVFAL